MYEIKRLQADRGTWYWVVSFSRNGVLRHRRFYDPRHGGCAAARRAAIAWRCKALADTKVLHVLEFCKKKRSNINSGVPGVHFLTPPAEPAGIWRAKLKLADGTRWTKSFSVQKYGFEGAFARAVTARRKLLSSADDRPYLNDPVAKRFAALQTRRASA